MTASISTTRPATAVTASVTGVLPGFGALVRKELTEWRRARRSWVVFLASTLFLTFGSLNAWLIRQLPADMTAGEPLPSLDPLGNPTPGQRPEIAAGRPTLS